MRSIALASGVLLATSVLAGCGDDGSTAGGEEASARSVPSSSAPAGDCATSLRATWPDGTESVLDVSAQAAELGDGRAYTLYAGDYEIPADGIGTDTILPPEGSELAIVFLTAFNATTPQEQITAGTTVAYTDDYDVLTFSAILYRGETFAAQSSAGASGELTVVAVDDASICVDVDYRDAEKAIVGQIAAPVHDSPF